jgi:hypothetical protein
MPSPRRFPPPRSVEELDAGAAAPVVRPCQKVAASHRLFKEEEMKTFLIIFWIHQAIFGLSSLGAVLNLLLEGGATNQSNLVPLLLAMIAGSLTWGFGFVMAERLRSWASQA